MSIIKYFTNRDLDREFYHYISGRSVALIGPAPSIEGSNQVDFINSHDIVVRMNRALPITDKVINDTGSRCDVLYHCGVITPDKGGPVPASDSLEWFCLAHNMFRRNNSRFENECSPVATEALSRGYKLHVTPLNVYDNVNNWCGHPNIGTTAIFDLITHSCLSLYITGMTVGLGYNSTYKTDVDEDTVARSHVSHNFARQRMFINMIIKENKDKISGDTAFMSSIGF